MGLLGLHILEFLMVLGIHLDQLDLVVPLVLEVLVVLMDL